MGQTRFGRRTQVLSLHRRTTITHSHVWPVLGLWIALPHLYHVNEGAGMSAATVQVRANSQEDGSATKQEAVLSGDESRWQAVMELPCHLSVDIPLPNFRVRDFLGVRAGSVIRTNWSLTRDVPWRVNDTLMGWGELEGTNTNLALRLTELAESEDAWK